MLRLYHYEHSLNCYKVRLLLAQLGKSCELVPIDLLRDGQYAEAFQRISISNRVPVLITESGEPLSESAAILLHLAEGTPFLPAESGLREHVLEWLFYEQWCMSRSLFPLNAWIATWRITSYPNADLTPMKRLGLRILSELDRHLRGREFMVGDRYTIADIALYAYAHRAPTLGFDISQLQNLQSWLGRVQAQPNRIEFQPLSDEDRVGVQAVPMHMRSDAAIPSPAPAGSKADATRR